MEKYLTEFFKTFEYSEVDTEFLTDTYKKIADNNETKALMENALRIYDNSYTSCNYDEIIKIADIIALKLNIYEYTVELLIFICLSKRTKEIYEEQNIDMQIFKDTMLDLKYKMWECQAIKGITGTFVPGWFGGFFSLTRFALGRLQFEIIPFGKHYEKNGYSINPDTPVINVHIPRSLKPLDESSCDEAFAKAVSFFKDKVSEPYPFVCESWLLYPENKNILNEKSNTVRFINRFDIIDFGVDKHNECLWRLFDTDEKNVDRLPDDTSMRRAFIEYLKNGGKTGHGYGVFFFNE